MAFIGDIKVTQIGVPIDGGLNVLGTLFVNGVEVTLDHDGNIYTKDGTIDGVIRTVTGENDAELSFQFYDTDAATFTTTGNCATDQRASLIAARTGDGAGAETGSCGILADVDVLLAFDSINLKGMVYEADYSANFTDRSLVDKEYVDNLPVGGDITRAPFTVTTNTAALGGQFDIYANTTTAAKTLTLSTADITNSSDTAIWEFDIKDEFGDASNGFITIDTEGAELIDGVASVQITADFGVIRLYSDGTNLFSR